MPGLQVLGGLPRELQTYVNFSIGVAVDSRSPEAARALARYLRSPDVAGVFRAKGMERID